MNIDTLIHSYNRSNERPYTVTTFDMITLEDAIQLINEGYDLDLSYHESLLKEAIIDNDLESVTAIYKCYSPNTKIRLFIEGTSPKIVKLLREHFDRVVSVDNIDYNEDMTLDRITNIIDNMDPYRPLEIIIDENTELLRLYAKLLGKPVTLTIEDDADCNLAIDRYIVQSDLSSMDHDSHERLLSVAIRDGNYELARNILNVMDRTRISYYFYPTGLTGLQCMLDLSEEYPELVEDPDIGSNKRLDLIVSLINVDYYLQYCMDQKYWDEVREGGFNYADISNPNAIRAKKNEVNNCDYYIDLVKTEEDGEKTIDNNRMKYLLRQCMNVIPATYYVDPDNVNYLIEKLGGPCDNMIMTILITLHQSKLIDLRGYNGSHPYLTFIAERLPIDNRSRTTKNARNVQ